MTVLSLRDRNPFSKPWRPTPRGDASYVASDKQKPGERGTSNNTFVGRVGGQVPELNENGRWKRLPDEGRKHMLASGMDGETLNKLLEASISQQSPVRQLIGNGRISIAGDALVVLETDEDRLSSRDLASLKRMFTRHSTCGFLDWLGGAKGWRVEECRSNGRLWVKDFVLVLNHLQSIYRLFASKDKLYMPDTRNELVWKKHRTLRACVSDVRVWLETLPMPRSSRVDALFRNSNEGPDSPLHWSHHHPQSTRFNLTVVTVDSMTELVNVIIGVFRCEFSEFESDLEMQLDLRRKEWPVTTKYAVRNKED